MLSSQMLSDLLRDSTLRDLFMAIAEKQRLEGRDLISIRGRFSVDGAGIGDKVDEYLERLKNEGLIEVDGSSPIPAFRIYYITSDGLAMFRELRRILAVSSTNTRIA